MFFFSFQLDDQQACDEYEFTTTTETSGEENDEVATSCSRVGAYLNFQHLKLECHFFSFHFW